MMFRFRKLRIRFDYNVEKSSKGFTRESGLHEDRAKAVFPGAEDDVYVCSGYLKYLLKVPLAKNSPGKTARAFS